MKPYFSASSGGRFASLPSQGCSRPRSWVALCLFWCLSWSPTQWTGTAPLQPQPSWAGPGTVLDTTHDSEGAQGWRGEVQHARPPWGSSLPGFTFPGVCACFQVVSSATVPALFVEPAIPPGKCASGLQGTGWEELGHRQWNWFTQALKTGHSRHAGWLVEKQTWHCAEGHSHPSTWGHQPHSSGRLSSSPPSSKTACLTFLLHLCVCVVLGTEPRAVCMAGKCPTTEPRPSPSDLLTQGVTPWAAPWAPVVTLGSSWAWPPLGLCDGITGGFYTSWPASLL